MTTKGHAMVRRYALFVNLVWAVVLASWAIGQTAEPVRVRWGPILGDLAPTRAVIAWATNQPARCRLICDGREWRSSGTGVYHSVVLEALRPNAEYEYYVEAFAEASHAESDRFVFRTPPANLAQWSFVVFGDTRSLHADHRSVVDSLMRVNPRPWLIIHTGDLVTDGLKPEEWDVFFDIERPILGTIPYYPVLGNHEKESELYYKTFPTPAGGGPFGKSWYSFRFANALFVMLNTNLQLDEQAKYLEQQLAAAKQQKIRWRFLTWHSPPYSTSKRGGDENVRKHLVPVIDEYGATCVFCGHDHFYEHSLRKGVHYVISGGGGAPRYPADVMSNPYRLKSEVTLHFVQVMVSPTAVGIRAIRPDGSILDHFVIR